MNKLKGIERRIREHFFSVDSLLVKRLMLKMGEESRLPIFSQDELYNMAYELYCNSSYYAVALEPTAYYRDLIDGIVESYFLAQMELELSPRYISFVGGQWEKLSKEFSNRLKEKDEVYTRYLSIGSRSYKSFKLISDNGRFRLAFYLAQVSLACTQFEAIRQRRTSDPLVYKGYHQFNYPYFHYKNFPLNLSIFSLEMIDFILQKQFLKDNPLVCEIGTGDGFVAKEILSNIGGCKYILFDLPEVLTRSQFLLSTRFPHKRIASLKELKKYNYDMGKLVKDFDIIFLPAWHVTSIPEHMNVDLWLNTHSFGEMPVDISRRYCEVMDKTGKACILINRDRDLPFGKNDVIHDTRKFLSVFTRMKVREVSYPITSNYMTLRPSNVRLFLDVEES